MTQRTPFGKTSRRDRMKIAQRFIAGVCEPRAARSPVGTNERAAPFVFAGISIVPTGLCPIRHKNTPSSKLLGYYQEPLTGHIGSGAEVASVKNTATKNSNHWLEKSVGVKTHRDCRAPRSLQSVSTHGRAPMNRSSRNAPCRASLHLLDEIESLNAESAEVLAGIRGML